MKVDLGEIIRQHGSDFLKTKGSSLCYQQKKALKALGSCRTGDLGKSIYQCDKCRHTHVSDCSCSNRHCPLCQGHKTISWVKSQEIKKLPIEYFFLTFTIPSELRPLIKKLQSKAYQIMFKVSSEVIKEMMGDERNLGVSDVGFSSILHTWGSQLQYHPHIHVILPGGGVTKDGKWKSFPCGFGLKVRAASKLWQGKLLKGLEDLVGRSNLPDNIASKKPIVYCKSAGDGRNVIKYLSEYVFKVAISNHRIVSLKDGFVTFKYKKRDQSTRMVKLRLSVNDFLSRFVQHILPRGFVKVRHYGFNHPNSNTDIVDLKLKITGFSNYLKILIDESQLEKEEEIEFNHLVCINCKGRMKLVEVTRETSVKSDMTG